MIEEKKPLPRYPKKKVTRKTEIFSFSVKISEKKKTFRRTRLKTPIEVVKFSVREYYRYPSSSYIPKPHRH